ncbi:mannitol dehydrogenase family protein [Sphingomonas sp. CL5.1]|nr:mannitol dehydrogenase family protein [Sphingomonas sp. CL5.1]
MAEHPRLSNTTMRLLPSAVFRPRYDRAQVTAGVLHFGPGAFHRAHQAAAFDTVLHHDPAWGIAAVGINSARVAEALRPQDGLYTLTQLDQTPDVRVIGSIKQILTTNDQAAIVGYMASPETRLITCTVTEKGYCLDETGQLDWTNPAIRRDLASNSPPSSVIAWIVTGLAARRAAGSGPIAIMSCDNLSENGRKLAGAVRSFAERSDPDLARWIEDEVRFPSTMVDSITPATDDLLRRRVVEATGLADAWPIQRERFSQWVIEDSFGSGRPPLDLAGATFAGDVRAFETAKLRLLNGAHSTLAYIGLLLRYSTVVQAMADPQLARFVEELMRRDITPSLRVPSSLSLPAYIDAILARFANSAIEHKLSQIAWDGSQKLPYRLLDTVRDARQEGRPINRLAVPIAAWFRFLASMRTHIEDLVDPLAARLLERADDPAALLDLRDVFGALAQDAVFRREVIAAHSAMADPRAIARALV